jgi:hypothetical protein
MDHQEDAGVRPQKASYNMTHRMPVVPRNPGTGEPETFRTKPSPLASFLFFASLIAALAFVVVMVVHGVQSHPGSLLDDLRHGALGTWVQSL